MENKMSDINFIKLSNFRDLGGIKTQDGKTIKPNMLLRSGQLFELPEEEVKRLSDVYNLKTVVDFRGKNEILKNPNVDIAGTKYLNLEISNETGKSTSKDEFKDVLMHGSADDHLVEAYDRFIRSDIAIQQFKDFLDTLLNQEEGAVLWHCFAGKDRTGMAALYLLTILNVSDEEIMKDYLLTNELRKRENDIIIQEIIAEGATEKMIVNMQDMMTVKPLYLDYAIKVLDESYGGRLNYIRNQLNFDDEKMQRLRDKYLDER